MTSYILYYIILKCNNENKNTVIETDSIDLSIKYF